jgi:hypothetical protein
VKEDQVERFRWSILALAQTADVQLGLFPSFAPAGEELALSFEEGLEEIDRESISSDQKAALLSLDQLILSLSGEKYADLWFEEEALRSDERWAEIRLLAKAVAAAFGWQIERPSPSPDLYIGGQAAR